LTLPGYVRANDPDGFAHRDHVVQFLEEYAVHIQAPIRLGVTATVLQEKSENGYRFALQTDRGAWEARNVVLATGPFQRPSIPPAVSPRAGSCRSIRATIGTPAAAAGPCPGRRWRHVRAEIAHEPPGGRDVYLSIGGYRKGPRRYRGGTSCGGSINSGYGIGRSISAPTLARNEFRC
jgi:putative flavoprotein involved in K+ transport